MTHAVILGDRGGGTTTFLGLLYAALVRYGTEGSDGFRVHASHGSIRSIKEVYACLMDGHFPPAPVEYTRDDLSFRLGYGPSGYGWAGHRAHACELEVHVADVHEVAELSGRAVVLDDWLRSRLESRVAIFLVDATRLPLDPSAILQVAHHPWRKFDASVAATLGLLETYQRAARARRRARIHPVFVLTKADLTPDPLRRVTAADRFPPKLTSSADRTRWVRDLLAPRLPQTFAVLTESGPGIRFEPALGFLSWVGLEAVGSGPPRIRRETRTAVGGWEPQYPYAEYGALLRRLHEVANARTERLALASA